MSRLLRDNEINTMEAEGSSSSKSNILDSIKLDKALRLASKKSNDSQIEEAKNIYEDILKKYPKNKQALIALHLLARGATVAPQDPPSGQLQPIINLYSHGHLQQALSESRKMLGKFPNSVSLYNIAGAANAGLRLFDAAVDCYKKALKIKPDYAEAYNNMGAALKDNGNPDAAIANCKQALKIKPDFAEAYNNIGNALQDKGEPAAAIDSYKQALKIKPDFSEAYNNLGVVLRDKGEPEAAIDSFKRALKIRPGYAEAYDNMGIALRDKGEPEAAIDSYKKALKIKPDFAKAYNNMSIALKDKGDPDAAIDSCKQALKIMPDYANAYNNMGNALQDKCEPEAAADCYKMALKIKPDFAEAYNNLGAALQDKGDPEASIVVYKIALKIKPDYAEAYYNKSLAYLLLEDYKAGWLGYEWRLLKNNAPVVPPRKNLVWDGKQSLKGKRFLIYEEQGLGDIIQFCRYLPFLQEDAQVTFQLTPKLHALIATMNCDISLSAILPNESDIDFEAPLMSLPLMMGTNVDTIPAQSPYLFADDARIQAWQKNLLSDKFKIGICWQGSKLKIDRGRSFPLELFEGISNVPGVELISLHKGDGEEQLTEIAFNVKSFGMELDDGQDAFLDTAAVIMNCDLIITSDTAVAHLAGALGRQTWVVLQHIPDWRWMLNRSDSPWYPSMTLYRQNTRGDWLKVFRTMEQDLRSLINLKGI
jgi:tetratricopeptide (TPR) repeat protein